MTDHRDETLRDTETRLGVYLTQYWRTPTHVSELAQIPGGAARATWRCTAIANGEKRGLIVRIDSGKQLLPTEDKVEYLAIAAVFKAGLPAPEPVVLEEDVHWLGGPFCVFGEVSDCKSAPDQVPEMHRSRLGRELWSTLGRLARLSPTEIGADTFLAPTTPETCAAEQLAYWWDIFRTNEIHPNPIAHAGYRWLAGKLPPAAQKLCLVHGDYRTGNYLYAADGTIKAILDWEMAHIGDPLEDLAWSLDLRQNIDSPDLAGSLIPHRDAIRIWQEASGLTVDPVAFRWWQIFSAFKALAIWTLSARTFQTAEEKRPVLARIGWLLVDRQQRILLDYISPHSARRHFEFAP